MKQNNKINNEQHWRILVLLLKEIAAQKKITQQEIAELTGIKQPSVSRIFKMNHIPTLDIFLRLAYAIEVSPSEITKAVKEAMKELGRRPGSFSEN